MSGMLAEGASPRTLPSLCVVQVFSETTQLRAVLVQAYESNSQSRVRGGIIITIKTIEAAEMSCLLQSMVNSLARGQAA